MQMPRVPSPYTYNGTGSALAYAQTLSLGHAQANSVSPPGHIPASASSSTSARGGAHRLGLLHPHAYGHSQQPGQIHQQRFPPPLHAHTQSAYPLSAVDPAAHAHAGSGAGAGLSATGSANAGLGVGSFHTLPLPPPPSATTQAGSVAHLYHTHSSQSGIGIGSGSGSALSHNVTNGSGGSPLVPAKRATQRRSARVNGSGTGSGVIAIGGGANGVANANAIGNGDEWVGAGAGAGAEHGEAALGVKRRRVWDGDESVRAFFSFFFFFSPFSPPFLSFFLEFCCGALGLGVGDGPAAHRHRSQLHLPSYSFSTLL